MQASPLSLVILGASGDLTERKLVPALFRLARKGRIPPEARIVGVSRSPLSDDAFREKLLGAIRESSPGQADASFDRTWDDFARRLFYVRGDAAAPGGLDELRAWLAQAEGEQGGRRLFYLALAPSLYGEASRQIAGMLGGLPGGEWHRLVIEKPFGHDLPSARSLNHTLQQHFREEQIYRIDHYLGKETVQNILVFRFANTLFEPLWNQSYIDHVQITVSEAGTLGGRGGYYDHAGVLRDMFQNHLLQLLTMMAMEAPARFLAEPLRNEKVKVLDAVKVPTPEEAAAHLVLGQYAGYHRERGVAEGSRTPTFAALRLEIESWRWRGVPFYLRSGKGLNRRYSEVIVQFRCPPHMMFPLPQGSTLQCNRLAICIQPDEGIHLNFQTKVPDQESLRLRPADMEFHYHTTYGAGVIPDAYERLLQDALEGDASLFMRSDEIEGAWKIMDPFLIASEKLARDVPESYPVGSTGPASAQRLLQQEGRSWLSLCQHD